LCLLLRGDVAILIVYGEISYGKHKKLSHPFLGVGFSATSINYYRIEEFGGSHLNSLINKMAAKEIASAYIVKMF
jgi:hypothetical protein